MAVTTISNKAQREFSFHAASANATLVVAGNSSVSNCAVSGETVVGATVAKVIWGTDSGSITLKRGANTVAVYNNSGFITYDAFALPITVSPTANVTVEFTSANAYIIVSLHKTSSVDSSDYFKA